jgi:hypothetical protein
LFIPVPVLFINDRVRFLVFVGNFVFGAKSASDKPAAPGSLFGSFAPAGGSLPSSIAAEPPKPTFGVFSFAKKPEADAGDKATSAVAGTKTVTETGGDVFAKFKPKAGKSWQ